MDEILAYIRTNKDKTWQQLSDMIYREFGEKRSGNAWRKFWGRNKDRHVSDNLPNAAAPRVPPGYKLVPKSIWQQGDNWLQSYQLQPNSDEKPIQKLIQEYQDLLITPIPKSYPVESEKMAIFSLYDPHFGKLTLQGDDIVATYKRILTALIYKVVTREGNIGRPVLVIGQDYANFDTVLGTTSRGTPQGNNLTWRGLVTAQIQVAKWAINSIIEHFGSCEVVCVPGNHSKMNDYWLYSFLNEIYPAVYGGDEWYALRHHNVGVFFIHGDEGRLDDYTHLWATKSPETWAFSQYREVHTGHLHTRKEVLWEKHGLIHRWMPGLCGTDDWHNGKLYTGNWRMGIATVYDQNHVIAEYPAWV